MNLDVCDRCLLFIVVYVFKVVSKLLLRNVFLELWRIMCFVYVNDIF